MSSARASSVAAPPPFRQPRSAAIASRVKGTWRSSTSPRSRQREQTQTITSKASAPSGGPASMRWTRPSWSVASSRRTSSPPRARRGAERQRPLRARLVSTQARSDARPSVRGGGTRSAAGRHCGLTAARPARWPPRAPAPARGRARRARGAWGRASWEAADGPFIAPPGWEQGGNETGRDDPRRARPGLAEIPLRKRFRETTRDDPRPRPPTLNPKVEGSNPSRPITDDRLKAATTALQSWRPRQQPWRPPTRSPPSGQAWFPDSRARAIWRRSAATMVLTP